MADMAMFSTVHTNALGSVAIAFGFFLKSVAGMTAIDLDAKVVASNHTPVAATLPLYAANGVEWPVARRFRSASCVSSTKTFP